METPFMTDSHHGMPRMHAMPRTATSPPSIASWLDRGGQDLDDAKLKMHCHHNLTIEKAYFDHVPSSSSEGLGVEMHTVADPSRIHDDWIKLGRARPAYRPKKPMYSTPTDYFHRNLIDAVSTIESVDAPERYVYPFRPQAADDFATTSFASTSSEAEAGRPPKLRSYLEPKPRSSLPHRYKPILHDERHPLLDKHSHVDERFTGHDAAKKAVAWILLGMSLLFMMSMAKHANLSGQCTLSCPDPDPAS